MPRPATHVQVFLSTVSAEFRSYRDRLARELVRPNVAVKVQEDFVAAGVETLDKLDDYLQHCHAVVHLVGGMTGSFAGERTVAALVARYPDFGVKLPELVPFLAPGGPGLSYTMWEAYLALYHGRVLLIAVPQPGAARDAGYVVDGVQQDAQAEHLARLAAMGRYPEVFFASAEDLCIQLLRSKLHDILEQARAPRGPVSLPFPSLGALFVGREKVLETLRASLVQSPAGRATAIAGKAVHGLGGVGKTRLAVEYGWKWAHEYSAVLFVVAETPAGLHTNLAALAGQAELDLPEQAAREEEVRVQAVLRWLAEHPGWLLILDNVDTKQAAAGVNSLLARLQGGHVLLTGRMARWPAEVERLPVGVLLKKAAVDFLLGRTATGRRKTRGERADAQALAHELGYLPLALEQSAAYINEQCLTFAEYHARWRGQDERVRGWFDESVSHYPRSVATTWLTSVEQLSDPAKRLLERLAWLAPEPIPEFLLDVPVPGLEETEQEGRDNLAELATYSLVARSEEAPTFSVHRLVQEVTRASQRGEAGGAPRGLVEALGWVDAGFVGQSNDVRTWPRLDPLAPHAAAVTAFADGAGVATPTGRLTASLGLLLKAQARYSQAEPLQRRALAIDEKALGAEHPEVAIHLNNLAQLLKATNRLDEAEPLMRRALAIDEKALGAEHPDVATDLNNLALLLQGTNRLDEAEPLMRRAVWILDSADEEAKQNLGGAINNLAQLLQATNRLDEAEPLMRRALAIDEKAFGSEHPEGAIRLNNLAQLLQATNRHDEAEPLMRRGVEVMITTWRRTGHRLSSLRLFVDNYRVLRREQGRSEAEIEGELAGLGWVEG